jgi:tetratricopeptide (TPR) repeat protein
MSLKDFGKNARALGRSPIGIIALFVVFLYASFTAVLTVGNSIPNEIKIAIGIFMIVFPVLILLVFYLLVTKHPEKLYSPTDFRDEQHFVNLIKGEIHDEISDDVQTAINERISQLETQLIKETLYLKILTAKSQGFNRKALKHTEELLSLEGHTSEMLRFKAYFLGNIKNYSEALETIDKAIELNDFEDDFDRAKARYNRACYRAMLNKPEEEIIGDIEAAISCDRMFLDICRDDEELSGVNLTDFLSRYEQ